MSAGARLGAWLLAVAVTTPAAGCGSPPAAPTPSPVPAVSVPPMPTPPSAPPPTPPAHRGVSSFEAVVRIDPEPGSKRFQGVWLERDDGERWLIAYRAEPLWRCFDGRRVTVEVEPYTPSGQAILASHARVLTLRAVGDEPIVDPVAVGAPIEARGHFERETITGHAKAAGQTITWFVDEDGARFLLLGGLPGEPPDGAVVVRARPVTRSPYVTHLTGDHLWVLSVAPAPQAGRR